MHLVLRILIALAFAAMAFVIGLFLPLSIHWFIHGDPGMPGGAALGLLGIPLGIMGAILAGLLVFLRFPWKHSK